MKMLFASSFKNKIRLPLNRLKKYVLFVLLVSIVLIFLNLTVTKNLSHVPYEGDAVQVPAIGSETTRAAPRTNENQTISDCGCTRKFLWPPSSMAIRYNSSCSDEGTFYRANQSVVSFALHFPQEKEDGRRKMYVEGILLNLERMRELYPGYSVRIYTDVPLSGEFCNLTCNNPDLFWCDIRKTPSLGDQSEMFFMTWRFLVLGDPTVDILLSRDLDSAVTAREAAVLRDWLQLQDKKAIYVMRDVYKRHSIPILGGLWGAKNSLLSNAGKIRELIVIMGRTMPKQNPWDQNILNNVLFYPMKKDIVAYDSYHCEEWKNYTMVRPFPMQRKDKGTVTDFVGNRDLGRKVYRNFAKCPVECRPSYGKDWEYC